MLLLSAGHEPTKKGASYKNITEFDLATNWVIKIANEVKTYIPVLLVPSGNLVNKVDFINKQAGKKIAIELHFNSDPLKKGKGTETLYHPKSQRGQQIAKSFNDLLATKIKPNRGAKEGWYKMDKPDHIDYKDDINGDEVVDYFLKATNCVALIAEPFFIHEYDEFIKKEDEYIDILSEACILAHDLNGGIN